MTGWWSYLYGLGTPTTPSVVGATISADGLTLTLEWSELIVEGSQVRMEAFSSARGLFASCLSVDSIVDTVSVHTLSAPAFENETITLNVYPDSLRAQDDDTPNDRQDGLSVTNDSEVQGASVARNLLLLN